MKLTDTAPLSKTRRLACTTDHAFSVFVDRVADWWPLAEFSVFGTAGRGLVVEHGVGGRILETGPAGEESLWGTLTAWEPGCRIAFTWHPGQPRGAATEVEVRFDPDGDGCLVTLTHSGWQRAGVTATRAGYDQGWPLVLEAYCGLVIR